MNKPVRKPSWWFLYLLVALIMGSFLFELNMAQSETARRGIELANILLVFGAIWIWLSDNGTVLTQQADRPKQRSSWASGLVPKVLSGQSLKQVGRVFWLYTVPVAILLSSILLPLQPLIRQGMIGLLLIWFQVSLMLGMFPT